METKLTINPVCVTAYVAIVNLIFSVWVLGATSENPSKSNLRTREKASGGECYYGFWQLK